MSGLPNPFLSGFPHMSPLRHHHPSMTPHFGHFSSLLGVQNPHPRLGHGVPGLLDLTSTHALLNMVRNANLQPAARSHETVGKRSSPKLEEPLLIPRVEGSCESEGVREIKSWDVENVCQFVDSIDICRPYVKVSFAKRETYFILPPIFSWKFRELL